MLLGCKTVKTTHYSVAYPGNELSFPWPMSHTQSHAEKSSALCSLAAEVQMVCLYASLTQCRSFTSALLCLLLLDSVHHSSTPVTLLCFALSSSLCRIFQLCLFAPPRTQFEGFPSMSEKVVHPFINIKTLHLCLHHTVIFTKYCWDSKEFIWNAVNAYAIYFWSYPSKVLI